MTNSKQPLAVPTNTDANTNNNVNAVQPKRYARTTRSVKVGTNLWPDVMELIRQHAVEHQLTASGAVHDCLRRYFNLPEIH